MSVTFSPGASIIVPCHQVTVVIAETSDSLRAQSFRNGEVRVVNDGCFDTVTLEVALKPYRGEIRFIKQDNLGRFGTRNTRIGVAHAPIHGVLKGDDLWEAECPKHGGIRYVV